MSYLVLARKYRPQLFADVVGQEHVTRTLANAIAQGRVAHAFLFTGSRGVGKTSTARILSKALNCVEGPTATPCNVCDTCKDITDGRAVDIIEIDGASNRGINEIREIREAVRYAPSRDRYKVYIIDEVHMLTTEAFNALLKTLEEPPAHAHFVFATTEPNKIPVTILSRCQRYDFKRVQLADIVGALRKIANQEGLEVDDAALGVIGRHARGGMRDALSAMDQVIAFANGAIDAQTVSQILGVASRQQLIDLGNALIQGDAGSALRVLNHVDQYGQDMANFAVQLLHHLRDLTVVAAMGSGEVTDLSPAELQEINAQLQSVPLNQLQRMFHLASTAVEEILRSQFPKLVLEMTVVKLAAIEPLVPLTGIVQQLRGLHKAIDAAQFPAGAYDAFADELDRTWAHRVQSTQPSRPARSKPETPIASSDDPEADPLGPAPSVSMPQMTPTDDPVATSAAEAPAPVQEIYVEAAASEVSEEEAISADEPLQDVVDRDAVVTSAQEATDEVALESAVPLDTPKDEGPAPQEDPEHENPSGPDTHDVAPSSSQPGSEPSKQPMEAVENPPGPAAVFDGSTKSVQWESWREWVHRIEKERSRYVLEMASIKSDAETMQVSIPSAYCTVLDDDAVKALAESAGRRFGRAADFIFVDENDGHTIDAEQIAARRAVIEARRQKVREDAGVQRAMKAFNVAPESIKVVLYQTDEEQP